MARLHERVRRISIPNSAERDLVWSPDGKKIATFQQDQRKTSTMTLVATNVGVPKVEQWKYPFVGDEHITMIERVIIDLGGDAPKTIRLRMPPDQHRSTCSDDLVCSNGWEDVQWAQDGKTLAFVSTDRGHKSATLRVADVATGKVHYYSRSRRKLWMKGESSGHVQRVQEIRYDCDADCLLVTVDQVGPGACHTGERSCFYRVLGAGDAQAQLAVVQQQRRADLRRGDDFLVRQVHAADVARGGVEVEPEGLAGLQLHAPGLELAPRNGTMSAAPEAARRPGVPRSRPTRSVRPATASRSTMPCPRRCARKSCN